MLTPFFSILQSGKILRKLLRDRAASEVGDGAPKASKM